MGKIAAAFSQLGLIRAPPAHHERVRINADRCEHAQTAGVGRVVRTAHAQLCRIDTWLPRGTKNIYLYVSLPLHAAGGAYPARSQDRRMRQQCAQFSKSARQGAAPHECTRQCIFLPSLRSHASVRDPPQPSCRHGREHGARSPVRDVASGRSGGAAHRLRRRWRSRRLRRLRRHKPLGDCKRGIDSTPHHTDPHEVQ
jgi:hypothetical protein